ncbi:hypothetical protein [Vibrio barjaei]|uniref:hypothetical protein n=1 Tax=Vibrio barjaei TaxID=1676683 RepID=UPI002284F04E|nr:hypothetical protein [Vibrio barjaei]MCY9873812.1 hypothetical protein [Vibrio barjaei]
MTINTTERQSVQITKDRNYLNLPTSKTYLKALNLNDYIAHLEPNLTLLASLQSIHELLDNKKDTVVILELNQGVTINHTHKAMLRNLKLECDLSGNTLIIIPNNDEQLDGDTWRQLSLFTGAL